MCIPNKIKGWSFPSLVCPDDNMPHFTIDFWANSDNTIPLIGELAVYDKAYEANVHFNYDEKGNVLSIDVCLIAPMPDCDPDEPIPYQVTEYGKLILEKYALDNPCEQVFVPRTIKE